ncbi:MAG: sigma-70 family RNA polymerase sigma factor [Actinobacteria bacterium]|nr:sigma-70 family RNA polymerase sigma factor [Actinomycetota bacterium]
MTTTTTDRRNLTPLRTLTDDPVRDYLNQAGNVPLLDREEEQDLAKRYQAGLAADRLLRSDASETSSADRRARLMEIRRLGQDAKRHMVEANLRLVVTQAKRFSGHDLDFIELIQDGNLGLVRAVEKFDHTKGYKFSTYAVWWIRQRLQRGVAKRSRTIRVPASYYEQAAQARAAEEKLLVELGRDPTDEEIAEEADLALDRLHEVRDGLSRTASLDLPVGEDGDATFGDLLPDEEMVGPEPLATEDDLRRRVHEALATLSEHERTIVRMRFGLDGQEPKTFVDIADELGYSREHTRLTHHEAVAKLREQRGDELAGLLDAAA